MCYNTPVNDFQTNTNTNTMIINPSLHRSLQSEGAIRNKTLANLDRSAATTAKALNIVSRVRSIPIDLVEDLDIRREVNEETKTSARILSIRGVDFDNAQRTQTSVAGVLGASLNNLRWIGYRDMASRILSPLAREARFTYIEGKDGEILHPLAVSPLTKDSVDPISLIKRLDPEYISYSDGQLIMTATPTGDTSLSVMGDSYNPSSFLVLPIDGYGDVHRFLGFMRTLCTNGLVLINKDFGEVIKNSSDRLNAIYSSLRNVPTDVVRKVHGRMLIADKTMISGLEFRQLLDALVLDRRASRDTRSQGSERTGEMDRWFSSLLTMGRSVLANDKLTLGSILQGDTDILGAVGCKASVLDTINMATELSSHHIGDGFASNTNIGSAVAKLLSKKRFNLEGKEAPSLRRDFWFNDALDNVTGGELFAMAESMSIVN